MTNEQLIGGNRLKEKMREIQENFEPWLHLTNTSELTSCLTGPGFQSVRDAALADLKKQLMAHQEAFDNL